MADALFNVRMMYVGFSDWKLPEKKGPENNHKLLMLDLNICCGLMANITKFISSSCVLWILTV